MPQSAIGGHLAVLNLTSISVLTHLALGIFTDLASGELLTKLHTSEADLLGCYLP